MAKIVSVAEAKKHFSDILGQVAYRGETFIISRRGRPVAKLVSTRSAGDKHLAAVKGWVDDDHPFFGAVEQAVARRHKPRVLRKR